MLTKTFHIDGMTCINCQNRIEKKLKSLAGVQSASVDYAGGSAKVTYDEAALDPASLISAVEKLGYSVPEEKTTGGTVLRIIGVLAIILALSLLLRAFSTSRLAASFPLAEEGMGYGMLLVIGLLTSVHCIAMCGGINLSQSLMGNREWGVGSDVIKHNRLSSHIDNEQQSQIPSPQSPVPSPRSQIPSLRSLVPGLLYNGGRLVSYTAVGFIVGALGSVITVSDLFRNIVLLIAGLLMLIMGINMLGLFPALRRFTQGLAKFGLPQFLTKKIDTQKQGRGPLVVGILNGFMPCGPLQAMQLYALSTGSPVKGGISMFLFCLGTVPLMFALGAAGGILSGAKGSAFSRRAMQVGAVLVAAMGLVMFTNGFSGAGFFPASTLIQSRRAASVMRNSAQARDGAFEPVMQNGAQVINSTLLPNRYPAITVQQGIPVRWTINAPQGSINGCNNRLFIREYGIQHTFEYGDNVIEFTPEKTGRFGYSCWMSMIRSTITVLAPGENIADVKEPDITPKPAGVVIPTDTVAVARIEESGNYQTVEINLTDDGFKPAVVVVQQGLAVLWTVNVDSLDPENSSVVFPAYYTQMEMEQGANTLQLFPTGAFDFSTANNLYYGYVKTVSSITGFDMDALKAEVENHETLIYPAAYFDRGRR